MATTILIVDDSLSIRQSTRFILEQGNYTVREASDGVEALKALSAVKANLVKKIRAEPASKFMPILVLTTESQGSIIDEGKKAGATGWIVKPFNAGKLLETVKKVVGPPSA